MIVGLCFGDDSKPKSSRGRILEIPPFENREGGPTIVFWIGSLRQ